MNFLVLIFATLILSTFICNGQTNNYFQQEVNYKIKVELNDEQHLLNGVEEFEYINHSSETLNELFIHLWPNAYKNSKTALAKQQFADRNYFLLWAPQKERGSIDSINFTVDGQKVIWSQYQDFEDIVIIKLNSPLLPGAKILVKTPFRVKLPSGKISRLGHIGQSYQITQWFPKPAVYDKNGWHEMPYLNQGEFYSEFGSFDVEITLPENYVVGATGDLQTKSEIMRMDSLSNLNIDLKKNEFTVFDKDDFPPSSAKKKTLHYIQKNVHDFGWFADKRWHVRKGSVELPHSKRKVTTWALFTNAEKKIWEKASIKALNDGVYYYSLWTGDYPYNQCTAVDGTISAGGGMEYPNVTVIGSSGSESALSTVIIHEVGHNWFYGILGSNERDNAWMDEGINSFFETRTVLATRGKDLSGLQMNVGGLDVSKLLGVNTFSYQYLTEELAYLLSARSSNDQPIQMGSDDFTGMNYGTIVYKKTAIAFNYLMNYLGEETFDQCMSAYFEAWKFRHPGPEDIRRIFEEKSGKDLKWFFEDLIGTKGKVDYRVQGIKKTADGYKIKVLNTGEISSPFSVDVWREGKLIDRKWFDGISPMKNTPVLISANKGDVLKVNYVTGIPEFDKNDNIIRTKGILKRTEPLKPGFFCGVDDPETTKLYWLPLLGWNNYNKLMPGIHLTNQSIPARSLNWSITPMYSISTNNLNGFFAFDKDNGNFSLGVNGQKFSDYRDSVDGKNISSYSVVKTYFKAKLFDRRNDKSLSGNLEISWQVMARRQKSDATSGWGESVPYSNSFGNDPLYFPKKNNLLRVQLNIRKKYLRSELRFKSQIEGGNFTGWGIIHQHSLNYDYVYRGKGSRKIKTRLYYGGGGGYSLQASGQRGTSDYAYDRLFLGRNVTDGILSQQFISSQGGLSSPTVATANQHILSFNAEIDLPVKLPLAIYAGSALLKDKKVFYTLPGQNSNNNVRVYWNVGLAVNIIPGILKVYLPLIYDESTRNDVKKRDLRFGQTILFDLNLNAMNPCKLIKNFDF
jgi:Peptidase family M1 domain